VVRAGGAGADRGRGGGDPRGGGAQLPRRVPAHPRRRRARCPAEVERLEQDLAETATALARREDPIIGTLLQDLVKDAGALSPEARRRLREQVGPGWPGAASTS
jgi:hypothetical protein